MPKQSIHQKNWYERHKAEHKLRVRALRDKTVAQNRLKMLEYLLGHPCVDCGEPDPIVLEFDHVRGTKDKDVSRMVAWGFSWVRILTEISKCEVRCANCHRRVTHKRRVSSSTGRARHS